MKRDSHSSSAEKKVMAYLGAKGETLRPRSGAKAVADMRVSFSTGTVWDVQVKACHGDTAAAAYKKEAGIALPPSGRFVAAKITPRDITLPPSETLVIAKVTPRGIEYRSAKTGRKLTPPGSKR
jgi:hypothetical protein